MIIFQFLFKIKIHFILFFQELALNLLFHKNLFLNVIYINLK